jgi:hypothetical protein
VNKGTADRWSGRRSFVLLATVAGLRVVTGRPVPRPRRKQRCAYVSVSDIVIDEGQEGMTSSVMPKV